MPDAGSSSGWMSRPSSGHTDARRNRGAPAFLRRGRIAALAAALLLPGAVAAQTGSDAASPVQTLPTVEVIGVSPLPGLGIDRDKVPSNARSLAAPDDAKQGPATLGTSLDQRLGSVNINANQNNSFQPDVQYRGFAASPVLGTPIGVAVYQNGVRLNEPFGDSLNWDLIPDFAINRMSVIPTSPVYGLNALGGALLIEMKNGFTFQGAQAEAAGGSFDRRQFTVQYGNQVGNVGAYVGARAYDDSGFRKLSPSRVRQLFADIGAESEHGSLHLSFAGANNTLIGIGPTPIQLVAVDRSAIFTSPQVYDNTLLMTALNGNYIATDTLSVQSNFYLRSVGRKVSNGNTSEVEVCEPSIPNTLCFRNDDAVLFDISGRPVPNILGGKTPGQIDKSSTASLGLGGSLQGTSAAPLFGHDNRLVVGASLDHAAVNFSTTNELGTINPANLVVFGNGVIIDQPDGSLAPTRLETTNSYYGFYATDTFEVTPKLALTLAGRYNLALIRLIDRRGTALNGNNRFSRFNPSAGATYKIAPELTGYVGYSEANRTPTSGEIACSDPMRPCSLDNFLSADPPGLRQVVAYAYEAGVRGRFNVGATEEPARIDWNFGLFRNDLNDDILNVPAANISTGFFRNIGSTRRQGIEANVSYRDQDWRLSADYGLIDATFQSAITLSSPNSPSADANGDIQVKPGNRLPGIPQHRLKINAEYAVTGKWTLGGNLMVASGQYFFGDQANQNSKLGGYWVVNLRSSYRVTDNVEVFALVENLFDNKYATFGIFGDVTKTPLPGVANPSDPRFVSAAPPLAVYGGIRVRF
jgi:iron complex outermembrane recepter protein